MKNFKDNKGFAKAMVIISVLLLSAIGVSLYFILTSSNSIKKEEYNLPSQLTNKNDPTTGGKGIVILEKNLGQLIFQGTSAGLEGISPKGFVGGKSAVYSGAIVVGVAEYQTTDMATEALKDIFDKYKNIGRLINTDSNKISVVKSPVGQTLAHVWQSTAYLLFVTLRFSPEKANENDDTRAISYLNEVRSAYIKIYPVD